MALKRNIMLMVTPNELHVIRITSSMVKRSCLTRWALKQKPSHTKTVFAMEKRLFGGQTAKPINGSPMRTISQREDLKNGIALEPILLKETTPLEFDTKNGSTTIVKVDATSLFFLIWTQLLRTINSNTIPIGNSLKNLDLTIGVCMMVNGNPSISMERLQKNSLTRKENETRSGCPSIKTEGVKTIPSTTWIHW